MEAVTAVAVAATAVFNYCHLRLSFVDAVRRTFIVLRPESPASKLGFALPNEVYLNNAAVVEVRLQP